MLPLPLQGAKDFFSQSIAVFDVTRARVKGVDTYTPSAVRTIGGVIQPDGGKEQNQQAKGTKTEGNLLLHTNDTINLWDASKTATSPMQTFVKYEGEVWKAKRQGDWADKTGGTNKYQLVKYEDLDKWQAP